MNETTTEVEARNNTLSLQQELKICECIRGLGRTFQEQRPTLGEATRRVSELTRVPLSEAQFRRCRDAVGVTWDPPAKRGGGFAKKFHAIGYAELVGRVRKIYEKLGEPWPEPPAPPDGGGEGPTANGQAT